MINCTEVYILVVQRHIEYEASTVAYASRAVLLWLSSFGAGALVEGIKLCLEEVLELVFS